MTNTDRLWMDEMPAAYERWLVPTVFRPFAQDLAARVAAKSPGRVLELAAGTGVVTAEILAAAPDAAVVATDLNPPMVEMGRSRVPGAEWRPADALDLPFRDGEFDVVACQFGVMFFPDKVAGLAEARRVLAPGGTLLANTWGPVDTHDFGAALMAGVEKVFPDNPPSFIVAVPHGYFDVDQVATDVRAAGFAHVSIETVTLEGEAASAADVARGFCSGTPLRSAIEGRADLESVIEGVAQVMQERLGSGPVTGRMTAHVIEAHD